jgi:hypothetical protein
VTTILKIGVDDFTGSGLAPASGSEFQFSLLELAYRARRVVTTKKWVARLDSQGNATVPIPDSEPGEALQVFARIRGWNSILTVAGYPTGEVNLVDLVTEYRVDPTTLSSIDRAPEAWWTALKAYVKTVNGVLPDGNGNIALTVDGGVYQEYTAMLASAQWSIPHQFGRVPSVVVRDATGRQMIADVQATAELVVVTFRAPRVGSATLT